MCRTGQDPPPHAHQGTSPRRGDRSPGGTASDAVFSALLEDDVEELYEEAPCGYLSTLLDGKIAKMNATLLGWLGYTREHVIGKMRFSDLLTVGGKLYHETHFAPLLRMQGEVNGIALELKAADGTRLPVLISSKVKAGSDGAPQLIRTTVTDARDRRSYEAELLRRRREAEEARREAELARKAEEAARQQAERDRNRLQGVLAVLQRSLVPPTLPQPEGLEAAAYYHTASVDQVGGDFYDLFALGDGRWCFFLGDVCGKGPEAAAVTSLTRYTLRAAAIHDPDPVTVLTTLNTALHQHYIGGDPRYCTAIFGTLTPSDAGFTVRLASGGHPPAVLMRADGTAEYLPTPGGLLVGILPNARFSAATCALAPGDTVVLYTDGLTEARIGPDGTRYGDEALLEYATDLAPATADKTVGALTTLLESFGDGLDDDTAILALGVAPAGSP
ncbi:PP2C family protein-serine/threonine phosphatase [Streptomyces lavendofoliae]|uniref:PP2C family protein-serine/threonine phosphatase n=1 Tax=Streptomyces lavendofoliae TaxID=67314 RepID=UPI003D93A764